MTILARDDLVRRFIIIYYLNPNHNILITLFEDIRALILSGSESFRGLKLTLFENFRALNFITLFEDFRVLNISKSENFRVEF